MARRGPEILARVPLGEMGKSDNIAEMVFWLSSERAKYVSGAAYNVDGGFMAWLGYRLPAPAALTWQLVGGKWRL